jgi:type II secretory ATPase GspE/PulE/Tfp pilus assembly ATPase PilB-like protein
VAQATENPVEGEPQQHDPFWLGCALVEGGTITAEQFASAKQLWRKTPRESFASILESLGLARANELAGLIARRHRLAVASLDPRTIDRAAARLLPLEAARRKCVLPYCQSEKTLHLAVEDPVTYGMRQAQADFPHHDVRLHVASRREIFSLLEDAWRTASPTGASEAFANLIRDAISERATDLHLEPRENSLDVRLRIDGRLIHRRFFEKEMREPLIQAAKIAGRIDITERRLPQDGQGCIPVGAHDYHLRFSCIPAVNGESIVVRIIDDHAGLRSFEEMGVWPGDRQRIEALLRQPNGLVYVTGPTGSGKTTLLYSMLHNLPTNRINELKIVTLEEPVEVRHPRFFLQIDVDERIGRTFGELLRHVLRHDPDVVLVGETRDRTTAEITLRAALTGRLCLSTLHTNDALGAINRLADIGLDSLMLASALRGVIAQRLVRRPCVECRRTHPQNDLLRARYRRFLDEEGIGIDKQQFYAAVPGQECPICRGRGFHGRTAIVEVCPLTGLERLIAERAPAEAFRAALRPTGARTLFEDGVRKAAVGLTTIEEVHAAIEEEAPKRQAAALAIIGAHENHE